MSKKPTVTTISSGYYSTTALNNNFTNIRNEFDNTLSLDGSTPNAMQADLDFNNNNAVNIDSLDAQTITLAGSVTDLSDIQALTGISQDIQTLADIEDGTVALNAISTLGPISADITTVSGVSSDVTTVAADGTDIGVVAGISSDVSTVSGISSDVTTVAADGTDIGVVAGISSDVSTVSGISADVTTVAADRIDIGVVAGISSDVSTVSGISSDVTTVAADRIDIGVVAGISSDITTVSGISSNVTTVANNDVNVTTVANNEANITTVANNDANVTTVANDIIAVTTNATNIADINTVAANVTDVTNFADVYLGPAASDPTTRNDGSALQEGDLYFNTTSDEMRTYEGTSWVAAFVSLSGALLSSNNLSDVDDPDVALSNLGLTATAAELNTLDGVTATTAELNALDGITATVTELNFTDGVTSAIQTQLDSKVSGVTAGTGLSGGGTSGSVTINGVTQTTAAWETGTSTTEGIVSPAKVKAAIDALADVGADYAALSAEDIGSVGFFQHTDGSINPGQTTAGSNLKWASLTPGAQDVGASPAGTWMALSYHDDSVDRFGVFKRVS